MDQSAANRIRSPVRRPQFLQCLRNRLPEKQYPESSEQKYPEPGISNQSRRRRQRLHSAKSLTEKWGICYSSNWAENHKKKQREIASQTIPSHKKLSEKLRTLHVCLILHTTNRQSQSLTWIIELKSANATTPVTQNAKPGIQIVILGGAPPIAVGIEIKK